MHTFSWNVKNEEGDREKALRKWLIDVHEEPKVPKDFKGWLKIYTLAYDDDIALEIYALENMRRLASTFAEFRIIYLKTMGEYSREYKEIEAFALEGMTRVAKTRTQWREFRKLIPANSPYQAKIKDGLAALASR